MRNKLQILFPPFLPLPSKQHVRILPVFPKGVGCVSDANFLFNPGKAFEFARLILDLNEPPVLRPFPVSVDRALIGIVRLCLINSTNDVHEHLVGQSFDI